MNNLLRTQRALQEHVLLETGTTVDGIVDDTLASAPVRLAIYHDAYRLRLLEVLGNELPGLRALAGAERFDALCRAYIQAHPSPFFNVRWYGDRLADHLARAVPWSSEPALAEMAALERDMTSVFDAPDEDVATIDQLATLPPEAWPTLRIRFHAAVRWRRLEWNVAELHRAMSRGEPAVAARRLGIPETCAVWRQDHRVRYRPLEPDEAALMPSVTAGTTFSRLCEDLLAHHPEEAVALRAAQILKTWIAEQWLQRFESGDGSP